MPIETITKELKQCTCYRCGGKWIPREEEDGGQRIPLCCAKCKSPYWDTPRDNIKDAAPAPKPEPIPKTPRAPKPVRSAAEPKPLWKKKWKVGESHDD